MGGAAEETRVPVDAGAPWLNRVVLVGGRLIADRCALLLGIGLGFA
jgi:hypothetical protein